MFLKKAKIKLNLLVNLGLLLLLFPVITLGQEHRIRKKKVPKAIITSFQTKYPKAKVRYWGKNKENDYFVKFNVHSVAVFDLVGNWIETKTAYSSSVVPQEIKTALIREGYKNWNIETVCILEKSPDSLQFITQVISRKEYYENYQNINKVRELYFTKSGQLLRKVDLPPQVDDWPNEHF